MSLCGWGNYPRPDNESFRFDDKASLQHLFESQSSLIAYGNGRSYGDSALNEKIVRCRPRNYFLHFDENTGALQVQSGVLLSEILQVFVRRGWFLKVTPGTSLITVGGAIASDVHGKNHHLAGCFSRCVVSFNLMLPDGELVTCSKIENAELFRATCGGMGLTGVILDARIMLTKIKSAYLDRQLIKTKNLADTFSAFENNKDAAYSVAWLDCLAKGDRLGRSLLSLGDFRSDGDLDYRPKSKPGVPFYLPGIMLNSWSIGAFNALYYAKSKHGDRQQKVDIDSFFYPLDAIAHWNRIYGRKGFVQYQFVLPIESSLAGMRKILRVISEQGKGSFLAVLKLCGKANDNYLSFPLEGYSLALDFKIEPGIFDLLNLLDEIVVEHYGRVYLAKDARISQVQFEKGYPNIEQFRQIRQQHNLNGKFNSLQSRRVGI
jgi:decaprenylphospho-beta-D-ribofuranose 2-oxidase